MSGSGFDLTEQLNASQLPLALLQLPSGHMLVSMRSAHSALHSTLEVWVPSVRGFASQPTASLTISGKVQALVPLADDGFAAVVNGSVGTLQVWEHIGQAIAGHPAEQIVTTSFPPTCALWAAEGLLVGTSQSLEIWLSPSEHTSTLLHTSSSVTALQSLPGGSLAMGTAALEVHIWLSTKSAVQGQDADMVLPTPSLMHSIAVLSDGTLVAGGAAFIPVKCPSGQFSPGGRLYNCTPCAQGWLSVPGGSSCPFPDPKYVAWHSSTLVGCLGIGVLTSQLLRCLCRRPAVQPWLRQAKLACSGVALLLSLAACGCSEAATAAEWVLLGTSLFCPLLMLPGFLAKAEGRYVALGLLVLETALIVEMLQTPAGQPSISPVGILRSGSRGGPEGLKQVFLLCALAFSGLAYSVPLEGHAPPEGVSQPPVVDPPGPPSTAKWRRLAAARAFLKTFGGETTQVLVLSVVTGVQMGAQLVIRSGSTNASSALTLCAVFLAAANALSSSFALAVALGAVPHFLMKVCTPFVDRHFRFSIVLKYMNLGLKLLVLILPFDKEVDLLLWWQCQTAALCPPSCTTKKAGTCGTAINSTNQHVCVCAAFETAQLLVMVNCALTALVSMGVTVMSVSGLARCEPFIKHIRRPRCKLVAQVVLAVVPAAVQFAYLLQSFQDPQCLALSDVALIVYPSMLIGLLANEVKRGLRGWGDSKGELSTIFSDDFLMTIRPGTALFAAVASACAAARARSLGPSWPSPTTNCGKTVPHWVVISMLFAAGAVASALLGPVALNPSLQERLQAESEQGPRMSQLALLAH